MRAEVRRLDPQAVIDRIVTMDEIVARVTAPWRFTVLVFAVLAVVACALASVGLFGMVALDVVQRHREFALRLAVGAQPAELLRLALIRGGRSAFLGIIGGLLIALVGTRAVQGMLFEVSTLDFATCAGVVIVIVTIVGLASYLPSRRAAAVDPLELLKA